MLEKKISMPFTLLALAFCICFVVDSFLELKVISICGLPVTAGLLLITISYIVSDCIVEVYGYSKARQVMWMTFAVHLFVVFILQLACWIPSADFWEGEVHFQYIFNLTPRITIVSMFAFIIGSSTNAYVMSKMKVLQKGKGFKLRAFVSTVAGEYVDAISFFPLAFYGLMPMDEIMTMVLVQANVKIVYELLVLPITSMVVKCVKKYDGIDTYDNEISYNIFSLA